MLGNRQPVGIIGADVAQQIRSVVSPSGHLNLALLQDLRVVLPITAPPLPLYLETFLTAAVAAEVSFVQLHGTRGVTIYPQWYEGFASPAAAYQLIVHVGPTPAVLPVLTGSAAVSLVQLDQVPARSPNIGTVGTAAAAVAYGQLVYQTFVNTTAVEGPKRISLEGLKITAGQSLVILTNAPNQAVRFNLAARLEFSP